MKLCALSLADFLTQRTWCDDTTGCLLWNGAKTDAGYGRLRARNGRLVYAHRYVWELKHGHAVPGGMVVRHLCDVRGCVNPAHLEIGTPADNAADRRKSVYGTPAEPGADLNSRTFAVAQALLANGFSVREVEDAWSLTRGALKRAMARHV